MNKALLRTYGCQMNERDSENIAATFTDMGWEITDDENSADVIVVNTCSVREQAEQKATGKLWHLVSDRRARGTSLPVIGVTGCMAQNLGEKIAREVPGVDFILGARKTHLVAKIAAEIFERRVSGVEMQHAASRRKPTRAELAKISESAVVDVSDDDSSHLFINRHLPLNSENGTKVCAFISIMQGCQMNCSYCIVPKVRGIQRSRPVDDIVREAEALVAAGAREITLLGQVVNAFAREVPKVGGVTEFVRLLGRLDALDGLERIRFTSPHPSYFGDDLIESYATLKKLCPYVHLPLQSGSDAVLRRMNRPYSAAKFLETVAKLRAARPDISISTDIIVGFPQETDADFEATRDVFRRAGFDMAFVFKYSPRVGTKSAESLDDVPEAVKEARNQALLADLEIQSLDFNRRMEGGVYDVLVEGFAKRGEGLMMGRTGNHRKVIFAAPADTVGRVLNVKILSSTVTALSGELV